MAFFLEIILAHNIGKSLRHGPVDCTAKRPDGDIFLAFCITWMNRQGTAIDSVAVPQMQQNGKMAAFFIRLRGFIILTSCQGKRFCNVVDNRSASEL